MTQNEMKTFQLILKEKGVEMTKVLRNREGILIEKAADELDEITTALERDIAVQKLDRESRLLRQILGALSRIESGTFGTCLHCDEEISRKRLAAVPWAPFCLVCAGGPPPQDWRGKDYLQDWLPRARSEPGARSWSGTDWPGSGLQLVPRYSLGRHDIEPIVLRAATLDQQSEPGGTGAIAQERDRGRNALELPVCRLDQDRV